jgi:uncharacterized membrane protein
LLFAVLPLYGAFFAAGFSCYVASLVRLGRYLRDEGRASLVLPAEASLHVLVSLGVFLGRFERLNSWDVLARPLAVVSALEHLGQRRPLLAVLLFLVFLVAAKAVVITGLEALSERVRRLRPHLHPN